MSLYSVLPSKAITKTGGKKLMQSGNYTGAVDVLKVLNSDEAPKARKFK